MALVPIVLVLVLVTVLLFFVLKDLEIMSFTQKMLGLVVLIILVVFAGVYTYYKSEQDKKQFLLQMAFLRGETLICQNQEVSSKDFNLVSGTSSLIGRQNSSMRNITFNLSECKSSDKDSQNLSQQLEKD